MNEPPANPKRLAEPPPQRETSLQRRLEFLNLTEEDAVRLRALIPLYQEFADDFVNVFYGHLFAFPETASFLRDEATVARLKELQVEHLQTMLEARWDEEFEHRRNRVGLAHARVGVSMDFLLGAYNQYGQYWAQRLAEREELDREPLVLTLQSLWKAILLDIGLTTDAYIDGATQSLRQALDLFWRANVELRHFAELASHDLKTPLATVTNLCDEVVDEFGEQMPAEAVELVERASSRAYRMSKMLDELLAKTAPHEHPSMDAPVSVQEPLLEAVDRVQPLLKEKHVQLSLPDSYPQVRGDTVRLREVFYNLLSNAAKYIDKDQGKIDVSTVSQDDACVIAIRDNGPGIPHEELERIFSAFRRLPAHRSQPGSGLGLYFAKNLVEQQGGKIWAESLPGEGSCFYVSLRSFEPAGKE